MGGNEDLIAAEPADAGRIGGDLEPFVVLIEDAEFRAVMDGEGGGGVFKRAFANGDIAGDDDGFASGTVIEPGGNDAGAEKNRDDGGCGEVESERVFERGTPFAEGEEEKAEPESGGGEKGPFVEAQFAEESLGAVGREGRSLNLVASELEIGTDVRIARSESFGLEVRGDGFADLAGFEVGVAEVVVEGDGFLARVKDVFVGGNGVGEFAGVVKVVGGVEGGRGIGK